MLIRIFDTDDIPTVLAFWKACPSFTLSSVDTPAGLQMFLARNPSSSFVAVDQNAIIGTILCGHDGRRGCIYHLLTHENHRRQGIAKSLVAQSVRALREAGIDRCNLLVFKTNQEGSAFWNAVGAEERPVFLPFTIAIDL